MRTYKLKIDRAFESKNGIPAAIFGYSVREREQIKVSGDFTDEELREDYLTVNVTDHKSGSGYHYLLCTGELPTQETMSDYIKCCDYLKVFGSLTLQKDKYINDIFTNVIKNIDIKDFNENIKIYSKRKNVMDYISSNKEILRELKERYIEEYPQMYAFNELSQMNLDAEYIVKIIKKHKGDKLIKFINLVKEDVYLLLDDEMKNILFVDDLALKSGVSANSKKRVKIICEYNLRKLGDAGCSWIEFDFFVDRLKDLSCEGFISLETSDFKIDKDAIKSELLDIAENDKDAFWISDNKTRIASRKYCDLEYKLYQIITEINTADNNKVPSAKIINTAIKACEKASNIKYTKEQSDAVKNTFKSNIAIICGAAGTGKSTVAKAVVETYKAYKIKCVALSGKAALRIGETTGVEGKTMHSTLNAIESGEKYIDADVIIIDEASMLGLDFFVEFLERVAPGATVLILGDSAQLTPIGSGNVFADMLASEKMNVNVITQVHRQALESNIIRFATDVRMQVPIEETIKKDIIESDFKLLLKNSDVGISRAVTKEYEELVGKYGVNDVIIVTPYKTRGSVNTFVINNRIQEKLIEKNAVDDSKFRWIYIDKSKDIKFKICVGDRVINIKNNYRALDEYGNKTAVMNGALGTVKSIMNKGKVIVDFDGVGKLELIGTMIDDLLLGYAISVHKSQGSQAKGVIYACPEDIGRLGCCEQIYTAVTRAQDKCIVIGTKDAINQCILTKELATKKTLLKEFLDNGGAIVDTNLKDFVKKYKPKKSKKKELVEETIEVLPGQVTIDEVLPETEVAVEIEVHVDTKSTKTKKIKKNKKLPKKEAKLRERYDKNNVRRKISRRNENLLNEREQAKVDNIRTVQDMLAQGRKNKDIVARTGLTKGTVSKYAKIDLEEYIKIQIEKANIN